MVCLVGFKKGRFGDSDEGSEEGVKIDFLLFFEFLFLNKRAGRNKNGD